MVERLLGAGSDVTVLNRGLSAPAPTGVRVLAADRSDPEAVRTALGDGEWDVVFDVSGFVKTTTAAAFDDLVGRLDGRVGRYVYVSSIMVYRPSPRLPWPETRPYRDAPVTSYGGFKVHAERTLLDARERRGFPATIARPAAIYGPGNNIYDMEAAMFLRLRRGLPVLLPHEGAVRTSYGHVDDLCAALEVLARHPAAPGEAFNITGEAATALEYVRVLADVVGAEPDVRYLPDGLVQTLTGPAFCHLFHRRHHGTLDTAKAARLLRLAPPRDLRTGHEQTYARLLPDLEGQVGDTRSDPLWGAGFDLAYEAEITASLPSRRRP